MGERGREIEWIAVIIRSIERTQKMKTRVWIGEAEPPIQTSTVEAELLLLFLVGISLSPLFVVYV